MLQRANGDENTRYIHIIVLLYERKDQKQYF